MIRCGEVCDKCVNGRCRDKPTEQTPLEIVCPQCDEKGCEGCGHTGWLKITGCPQQWVGSDTIAFIRYAELFRKGLPPVSGGAMDQTQSFIVAERFFEREREAGESDLDSLNSELLNE